MVIATPVFDEKGSRTSRVPPRVALAVRTGPPSSPKLSWRDALEQPLGTPAADLGDSRPSVVRPAKEALAAFPLPELTASFLLDLLELFVSAVTWRPGCPPSRELRCRSRGA